MGYYDPYNPYVDMFKKPDQQIDPNAGMSPAESSIAQLMSNLQNQQQGLWAQAPDPNEGMYQAILNRENVNNQEQQNAYNQDVQQQNLALRDQQIRQTSQDLNIRNQYSKADPRLDAFSKIAPSMVAKDLQGNTSFDLTGALAAAGFSSNEERIKAAQDAQKMIREQPAQPADQAANSKPSPYPWIDAQLHGATSPADFTQRLMNVAQTIDKMPLVSSGASKTDPGKMRAFLAQRSKEFDAAGPPPDNTAPTPGPQSSMTPFQQQAAKNVARLKSQQGLPPGGKGMNAPAPETAPAAGFSGNAQRIAGLIQGGRAFTPAQIDAVTDISAEEKKRLKALLGGQK